MAACGPDLGLSFSTTQLAWGASAHGAREGDEPSLSLCTVALMRSLSRLRRESLPHTSRPIAPLRLRGAGDAPRGSAAAVFALHAQAEAPLLQARAAEATAAAAKAEAADLARALRAVRRMEGGGVQFAEPLVAEICPGYVGGVRSYGGRVAIDGVMARSVLDAQEAPRRAAKERGLLRPWERSVDAAAEYASFDWPLTTVEEVRRLLATTHISPTWLLLGECDGAWAERVERDRGAITLSVDRRAPATRGISFQGEFHAVLPLRAWEMICAWPSCTHQALSNSAAMRDAKAMDGRMFWGLVGVLYVLLAGHAQARMVEQPDTTLERYFQWPKSRRRTSYFGDDHDKTICLYLVGAALPGLSHWQRAAQGPLKRRRALWEFSSADERERHRSSWDHFPLFLAALSACLVFSEDGAFPPTFEEGREALAVAWHRAGFPVPADYEQSVDGIPPTPEAAAYQLVKGRGDGRRPACVVPRSLSGAASDASTAVVESVVVESPLALRSLSEAQSIAVAALTARCFVLFFATTVIQPLIYAHLSGLHVIGGVLPLNLSPRDAPMLIMEHWAQLAGGASAVATTFLVGRYEGGPQVGVTALPFAPAEADVVRTPAARRAALAKGKRFAWATLAALAGCAAADMAARVLVCLDATRRPVPHLADTQWNGAPGALLFSFGATRAASLAPAMRLTLAWTPTEALLAADAANALLLKRAVAARAAEGHEYAMGWAERIRPPDVDLHDELSALLPDFADESLLTLPLERSYVAPTTLPLPRAPAQPTRATPFCVRSPVELLRESGRRKLWTWLDKSLDQLLCIEAGELNCELRRPHPLVIGQGALKTWARGVVWDFTFERAACAVPLDFTLPIESGLDLEFIRERLRGYPDQRLISFLLEGVRFEADVELHAVLVAHLISLPKGFASVRKELYRLEGNGWYKFFDHLPFWPIYLNGQGAVSRKLEERYRRTTECGGPRKPTFDEEGLRALSLNEATALDHFPAYFADRLHEPAFRAWLEAKGLLDEAARELVSSLPHEDKPTLRQVMNDLAILLAASKLLGEPIYIFGDDAKDYFNQLSISSEDWWKLGVIFLHPSDVGGETELGETARGRIFFVSERRLGFGAKISSNVAQRFSEAILFMLRQDMDAAEANLPWDERPSAQVWRDARARMCRNAVALGALDTSDCAASQLRLWAVHMYTDDPIFIVVGVDRALLLLECWYKLTRRLRLLMAIPEKRNLGTWAPWLGVILYAGLGFVIVPKAKLLRTAHRITDVLRSRCEFQEYRSLMGMLEHLRCVNCAPSSTMYGLYGPHRAAEVRAGGPSTFVRVTLFMTEQLRRWLELLVHTGGAPVTAALRAVRTAPTLTYVVASDAATDSNPPGIGGYCHGLYWHLPIPAEWLKWLHITVLEMLATGGSAIAFCAYLRAAECIRLLSDSLATPFVLSRHKAKSAMLSFAHHELLRNAAYREVAERADVSHISGSANVFGDAVSRALWKRFFALCRAVSVRPVQVPAPPELIGICERLVAIAQRGGEPVRQSRYHRDAPVLPAEMLGLGRRSPACEEADAVNVGERLRARLAEAAAGQQPAAQPRAPRQRPAAAARTPIAAAVPQVMQALDDSEVHISQRLAARLQAALDAPVASSTAAPRGPPAQAPPERPASRRHVKADRASRKRKLETVKIAGARLPALPPGATRDSALRDAAQQCAAQRAAGFAQAGLASNHGVDRLTRLLQHAADLDDFGSSHGTRAKNDTAWAHWVSFAEYLGFDPILTAEQVRDYPSHIATLLATFLLFIYPKMTGRKGRQWAKPRSAFSYVLAIIRIFRGWKLVLPPAKVVKGELHGLLRAFVNAYGVAALMPERREPFTFAMIGKMQSVGDMRLGSRNYRQQSAIGRAFRGILAVGWRTGHRLAEFVAHPSGELTYLTRGSVSYVMSGVTVTDPTAAQLAQLVPGDVILIQPPRSKTDQFGEIHCPFPSSVPYTANPLSAGNVLAQQDAEHPCRGSAREDTPLFADENGQPFTHSVMDTLLHHVLVVLFGAKVAACYSWHSMRVGLATALKAAKVDDAIIQMICRWMNPESLRAYARHGQSLHINCVDKAEKAIIDTVQAANVPKTCNSEGAAALHRTFGTRLSATAQAVLDAADDAEAATGASPPEPAPDLSPLPASKDAIGRRVLVARTIWPNYVCDENGGRGWTAHVINYSRGVATVRFAHATDARGLPYPDETLLPGALEPF